MCKSLKSLAFERMRSTVEAPTIDSVISDRDQFKSCHICALLGDDHRQLSVPPHCRFWLPFAIDPIGPNTRTYCIQFNELIAPVRAVRSYAD